MVRLLLRFSILNILTGTGHMENRHFMEPDSLATVAMVVKALLERTWHPIKFFQCPVGDPVTPEG